MRGEKLDLTTRLLRSALKVLGTDHKLRLSIGVCLGLFLDGLRLAALPLLAGSNHGLLGLALEKAGTLTGVVLGVLLVFLPLGLRKRPISEECVHVFDLMDEVIERGDLDEYSRRLAYREVLTKIVKSYSPGETLPVSQFVTQAAEEAAEQQQIRPPE